MLFFENIILFLKKKGFRPAQQESASVGTGGQKRLDPRRQSLRRTRRNGR